MNVDPALVAMARSSLWSDRVQAGQRLAESAGDSEVDELLMGLLLDAADTAVISDTAEALLGRGDAAAWRVFAGAWAVATPAQADHLAGALSSALFEASLTPVAFQRLKDVIELIASDSDEIVRRGATQLLKRLANVRLD